MDPDDGRGRCSGIDSSPQSTFFSLPAEIRTFIYEFLLTLPHPLFLYRDGTRVRAFAPDRPPRWLALLRANRQLHAEASAVAYGSNSFLLLDKSPRHVEVLKKFLGCIGSTNAGTLSHLYIDFPVVDGVDKQSGVVILKKDHERALEILRDKCTSLSTVEVMVHSENSLRVKRFDENDLPYSRQALEGVDAQLRTIPSLRKIHVKVYDDVIAPSTVEVMRSLGWVVPVIRGHISFVDDEGAWAS